LLEINYHIVKYQEFVLVKDNLGQPHLVKRTKKAIERIKPLPE